MSVGYENDRRFFTALILLSLGCFILESILRAYGLPNMPLRFSLKALATFIGIAVFVALLVRYKADRYSFFFIAIGLFMFSLTRAFEIDVIRQFAVEMLSVSEANFGRVVNNSVQKIGIYCVILSLISLIIVSAKRRAESANDAKARVAVEERLRASEAGLRAMFEAAPVSLSHVTLDGRHVMVNRGLCELVGYGAEELVGMSIESLIEPSDREECQRVLGRILTGDHSSEVCQIRYRHKNGFLIWVQNTVSYVEDGVHPPYLVVISEDVTERRRRVSQLTESVSLLEATIESTTDGILVVGLDGRITRFNQRFVSMWQIPEAVMESMRDKQVLNFAIEQVEDPDLFLSRIGDLYREIESEGFDVIRFKDGRVFERLSKPQFVEGKARGRVWSFRDVTAARRVETEQTKLQVKVREAQKMEALGTFASGIAHDFNNILSSILTNTEVVMTLTHDTKDVRECLEDIVLSCERSGDLIERILAFTRKEDTQSECLALEDIVSDAEKLIRPALTAAIELEMKVEQNLPLVLGNATQFHQILLNLSSNAAAAIQGQGQISIDVKSVESSEARKVGKKTLAPGIYVLIRVSDDGVGMDEAAVQRAFDPFYTTKVRGGASGLGLTVVQGIVSEYQGGIEIRSEPGKGTRVDLYVPATRSSEMTLDGAGAKATGVVAGEGQWILFVDDEDAVARSVSKRMQQLNYQIDVYTDPVLAMNAFKENPGKYELVMTDLTMPRMDGIAFAREVRTEVSTLPVILLTGYGDPSIHQEATSVGVCVILRKPVDGVSISWAVKEALSQVNRPKRAARIVS